MYSSLILLDGRTVLETEIFTWLKSVSATSVNTEKVKTNTEKVSMDNVQSQNQNTDSELNDALTSPGFIVYLEYFGRGVRKYTGLDSFLSSGIPTFLYTRMLDGGSYLYTQVLVKGTTWLGSSSQNKGFIHIDTDYSCSSEIVHLLSDQFKKYGYVSSIMGQSENTKDNYQTVNLSKDKMVVVCRRYSDTEARLVANGYADEGCFVLLISNGTCIEDNIGQTEQVDEAGTRQCSSRGTVHEISIAGICEKLLSGSIFEV